MLAIRVDGACELPGPSNIYIRASGRQADTHHQRSSSASRDDSATEQAERRPRSLIDSAGCDAGGIYGKRRCHALIQQSDALMHGKLAY